MQIASGLLRAATALLLLAGAAGCASVPMASADADAVAKQFKPSPDKATVYIYRNESMGAAIKMGIYVDEQPIGQTAANTYLRLLLAPGMHKIRSHAENNSEVELDAKAGQIYYFWQEVKMGIGSARNKLQQVDEATGRKGVLECELVAAGS